MFEIWPELPLELLKLAKYLLAPAGSVLFLLVVPLLWLVPQRAFRPILLGASVMLLGLTWGPTFVAFLSVFLIVGYPFARNGQWLPAAACWAVLQIAYAALFYIPSSYLPVFHDERLVQLFPGIVANRVVVFGSGLAFTNLRLMHLLLEARRAPERLQMTFASYLLFMLYAPTYRLGPFVSFGEFNERVDHAKSRITRREAWCGLGQMFLGALMFEGVIKVIDDIGFRPYYPDDGSYNYQQFFRTPPSSAWLTLLGVYFVPFRMYMFINAYSHVMSGMSRMIGIGLPRNMDAPLLASNLGDFWRRYHSSFNKFVLNHVYIPVAECMRSVTAPIFVVFVFVGFWHQPSWYCLLWALFQSLGVCAWLCGRRFGSCLGPGCSTTAERLLKVCGILLTWTFIALTTPILLDSEHGGAIVLRQLVCGDWWSFERDMPVGVQALTLPR
jgi:alginate O-acetyltransferase complex protein AlgI